MQPELFIKSRENTGHRNKNALIKGIETHCAFLVCLHVFNIDPGTAECPETLGYNSDRFSISGSFLFSIFKENGVGEGACALTAPTSAGPVILNCRQMSPYCHKTRNLDSSM